MTGHYGEWASVDPPDDYYGDEPDPEETPACFRCGEELTPPIPGKWFCDECERDIDADTDVPAPDGCELHPDRPGFAHIENPEAFK